MLTRFADFQPFSKLPSPLVPTSLQVMKFSGNFVKVSNDKKAFDWGGFKNAVNGYKGDDLTFDKFKDTTIAHSEATVSVMVDKIATFLSETLDVAIDPKELAATIEAHKGTADPSPAAAAPKPPAPVV